MIELLVLGDILVCLFLIGVIAWVYIRRDKNYHDQAARLPLDDD